MQTRAVVFKRDHSLLPGKLREFCSVCNLIQGLGTRLTPLKTSGRPRSAPADQALPPVSGEVDVSPMPVLTLLDVLFHLDHFMSKPLWRYLGTFSLRFQRKILTCRIISGNRGRWRIITLSIVTFDLFSSAQRSQNACYVCWIHCTVAAWFSSSCAEITIQRSSTLSTIFAKFTLSRDWIIFRFHSLNSAVTWILAHIIDIYNTHHRLTCRIPCQIGGWDLS